MIPSTKTLLKSFADFSAIRASKKALVVDIKCPPPSNQIIKDSTFMVFNEKFKMLLPGVVKVLDTPMLLVCDPTKTDEIIKQTEECGFTNVLGYLDGGFESWVANKGETILLNPIDTEKFKALYEAQAEQLTIFDVRNKDEWEKGVLPHARLLCLKEIEQETINGKLDDLKNKTLYLFCGLGPRAMIAISILRRYGFDGNNLIYVVGGSKKMEEVGMVLKKPEP